VQLSVAVAVPVAAGKVLPVHSMVTLGGHVTTGGVLSSMVMIAWRQKLAGGFRYVMVSGGCCPHIHHSPCLCSMHTCGRDDVTEVMPHASDGFIIGWFQNSRLCSGG
jgi:hypothetical protein